VAEFEARTLVAADYGTAANQTTIAGYLDTEVAAILAAVDTEVAAVKAKTDQLTFTVANQVDANALSGGGGLDAAGVRDAIGLAAANLDTQMGTLATASALSALVATVGVAGVGLSAIPKTGYKLAADGADLVLVDSRSLPAALQIIGAVVAGKISGAGTSTEIFVGLDGSTTRVTMTVDASGNRSAAVYS
jgi:hypothetical protein